MIKLYEGYAIPLSDIRADPGFNQYHPTGNNSNYSDFEVSLDEYPLKAGEIKIVPVSGWGRTATTIMGKITFTKITRGNDFYFKGLAANGGQYIHQANSHYLFGWDIFISEEILPTYGRGANSYPQLKKYTILTDYLRWKKSPNPADPDIFTSWRWINL